MDFEREISKLSVRMERIGTFLNMAEEYLFSPEVLAEEQSRNEVSFVELYEKYKTASKLQIDMYELVRKYRSQTGSADNDEVMALARMLSGLGDEELKQIRKNIMRTASPRRKS